MSDCWKPIVAFLSLLVLAAAGGCGHSGDNNQSPAASIDGTKNGTSSEGGSTTPVPPKPTSDSHPVVLIDTSLGKITVELDREKAMLTVDNFLSYVGASFYDQSIIHQVYKGQAIMAGGYGTNLLPIAKPLHASVRNEAANGLKNLRYTIAMYRFPDAIDGATSQFLINVADNPTLDYRDRTPGGYGYCVFGKVIDGMDVVDKINGVACRDTPALERTPADPIIVTSIRRIR